MRYLTDFAKRPYVLAICISLEVLGFQKVTLRPGEKYTQEWTSTPSKAEKR